VSDLEVDGLVDQLPPPAGMRPFTVRDEATRPA
jgi:hypothetical protein